MARPTNGRVTSTFGMRRHPILGYRRMHSGMDFGGGYGAPIYAVTDGIVTIAGRHGDFAISLFLGHYAMTRDREPGRCDGYVPMPRRVTGTPGQDGPDDDYGGSSRRMV